MSSSGGALLGLLKGGSVLIRSSRAAEVLLSNLHSLVRVVSRNWEHFTDVSSDVVRNFKGRVYRYSGYAKTYTETKNEAYKYHQYIGDVGAAEAVKTSYHTYTGTPATNTLIFKEQITDATLIEIMRRTLDLTGNQEVWIKDSNSFTRVTSTGDQLLFRWNDQNTVTINEAKIELLHKDGATLVLNAAGIKGTFQAGTVELNSSQTKLIQGSRAVTLTSAKVSVT